MSSITYMNAMFTGAGYNAMYSLDLSGWDVDKVSSYGSFNAHVSDKITSPVWNTSS